MFLALPLETLIIPLIVNDLFGSTSYDKILGIMVGMNYVGYALGAPLVNLCYDVLGSYKPVLLLFSALMIPIAIVFQFFEVLEYLSFGCFVQRRSAFIQQQKGCI